MKKEIIGFLAGAAMFLHMGNASAMSLNVQDGDIAELLRSVARMGGINLILDQSVTGQVSLRVENSEPGEVIADVVRARGLSLTKEGNTWIVAGKNNLLGNFASVHVIPVKYAPLQDIRNAVALFLEQGGTKGTTEQKSASKSTSKKSTSDKAGETSSDKPLQDTTKTPSKSNRVLTDISTGSLLVYATAEEAEQIKQLVQQLDVPAKQISIETKVISMSRDDASKLGVQWEWSTLPQYVYSGDDDAERQVFKDSGMAGGIVSFGRGPKGKPYEWQYAATIEAMVSNGKAEVLSRPNITTLQGQEAVINIGGEVPVPTVSTTNSTVTTSIEYRPVGIILRCLPMVNEDGYITSRIHTEVSSPSYVEEMSAYSFQKRSADTMVRLKDGETMVIGGLISSEEVRSMSKVPFLGDIPILGNLFKSIHTSKENSELFIILKAEILKEQGQE